MNLTLASSDTGLRGMDYVCVALYLAVVLIMGLALARRQDSSVDYFLGGRGMPWFAVGLSLVASLLSTLSYLGQPGELIRYGIAYVAGTTLVLPLAFLFTTLLWLPFFMRMRLTSVYEYLELRFGLVARWMGAFLFVFVLRFAWMAVIVLTASRAVAQITFESARSLASSTLHFELTPDGWVLTVLLLVGVLATVYTMLGGIKAVIWTDVLQFLVFLVGLLLTIAIVAKETGTAPVDWWRDATSVRHEFKWASWDLAERSTLLWSSLYVLSWFILTFTGDQVAMQRFFTTPSVKAAMLSNAAYFGGLVLIHILFALCGMALLTYYTQNPVELVPGITDPKDPRVADSVFPHFIEYGLPTGVSGLLVAALFAAAMSSVDSGINSVTTVLTVDVLRRLRADGQVKNELTVARFLTLVVGTGCTVLAWMLMRLPSDWNIIDITVRTFECALGPLGAMFIVGMFLPHVGQLAVVASVVSGLMLALAIAWWTELVWLLGLTGAATLEQAQQVVSRPSSFLMTPTAALFTFVLAAVLGALLPSPDPKRVRLLTWRGVVFGHRHAEHNRDGGADL